MRIFQILVISFVVSLTGSFGETVCPRFMLGDVLIDNRVNSADSTTLLRFLSGLIALTPCQRLAADVDADGSITRGDLHVIQSYIVQSIRVLPALYGDVSHNGSLGGLDSSIVGGYIQGIRTMTAVQLHLADVNRDGAVDYLDLYLIDNAVVGNIPKLPIPK